MADNTASITTAWRDEPLLPGKDDDLATLVRKARAARGRTVGFDWRLSPEELRCLRQAVHHWGSTVRGRYKLFDARVLAAINAALDEPDSAYVLVEPRASDGLPPAPSSASGSVPTSGCTGMHHSMSYGATGRRLRTRTRGSARGSVQT